MGNSGPQLRSKNFKAFLVAIIGLIAVFVVLETFQRVKDYLKWRKHTHTPYTIRFETWSGSPIHEKGGALALVHHPHLIYTFKGSQNTQNATINAQGFRGRAWEKGATGTCRIIFLGGSATFGHGASSNDAVFVAVLERLLNHPKERRIEVLNAGVTGYLSSQELVLTATVLLDYHPDVIIILDGWNDFHTSGVRAPGAQEPVNSTFLEFDEVLSRNTQRFMSLLRISSFFRWAEQRTKIALRANKRSETFHNYSDNMALYLPEYKKNLERIVRIARAHGSEVVIASQPELFQRKGPIPEDEEALRVEFSRGRYQGYAELAREQYPAFVNTAREVATAEGVTFVDSTAAFDEFAGVAFVDFVHFGDEGHKALAHFLYPTLSQVLKEEVANPACDPEAAHS